MTAIRDVELAEPLSPIDLPSGASRCFLVLRWRGRVVGRIDVATTRPRLTTDQLAALIRETDLSVARSVWLEETIGFDPVVAIPRGSLSVTVAVCTRERPDDLACALSALARQQTVPDQVLVVDNDPATNATEQVVQRFPFARYVREPRRGLNRARNRALRDARSDIVAFTDDDAAPEPEWLHALLPNFADRRIAAVTGLTLPLALDTEGQEQFERYCSFNRGFRRRIFDGARDNPLAVGPVGAGVNAAVRRDRIVQLGGFDERLDGGTPTRSGGDHDLFARVLLAGDRIVYDPRAVVRHRHRRTPEEMLDTAYGYGVGVYALLTGLLVERGEIGVLRLALHWFTRLQLRGLVSRDRIRRRIARQELRGCLSGPRRWFAARREHVQEAHRCQLL